MHVAKYRLTRERGRLVLQALKHTARGQSYVAAYTVLDGLAVEDEGFKTELPLAFERLTNETASRG